jgi:hypothetical protein
MKRSIDINEFGSGVDVSQFLNELLQTSFGSKMQGCTQTSTSVVLLIGEPLVEAEVTELSSVVSSHVPVPATDIESNAGKLNASTNYPTDRSALRVEVTTKGFENLTDKEKEFAALYCLADDMTIIGYYMSTGDDLATAQAKHLVRRSIDINKCSKVCTERTESPIIKYLCIKYMDEADAMLFMDAIRDFVTDYAMLAHYGLEYGHSREGIMDYIEATNGYANAGLSSYTFRGGDLNYENCKNELKQYLIYGIKPAEFDLFSI